MNKKLQSFTVEGSCSGMRIDRVITELYPALSRAKWSEHIDNAEVLLNGKKAKPANKVNEGDEISILIDLDKASDTTFSFDLGPFRGHAPEVVFEDEDIAVINKGPELAVHPGSGLLAEDTLLGWAIATGRIKKYPDWSEKSIEEHRPGIVHRLDRGTSGLLVITKKPKIHDLLTETFKNHLAQRVYWAVVKKPLHFEDRDSVRGPLKKAVNTVGSQFAFSRNEKDVYSLSCFLSRDPKDKTRYSVNLKGDGRKSLTHFWKVSQTDDLVLLELSLETGRTHQIRAHLNFVGNPVLGDGLYGGGRFRRVMLHAHTLMFQHPSTKKLLSFHVPWPQVDQDWLSAQGVDVKSKKELWPKLK